MVQNKKSSIARSRQTMRGNVVETSRGLSALNTLTGLINRASELEDVLDDGVGKIMDITGAEAASIWLLDEESGQFILSAFQGLSAANRHEMAKMKREEGIIGQILETKAPLISEDLPNDSKLNRGLLASEGFRSVAYLPLKDGEKVLGILTLASREPGRFSPSRGELLMAIAHQIFVALGNTRLFEETQHNLRRLRALRGIDGDGAVTSTLDLRNALDILLRIFSLYTKEKDQFSNEQVEFLSMLSSQAATAIQNVQLYEEMKNLTCELETSNRIKDEFLSVMSHELRTPLNVVMGYTAMIKDGMLGEISSQQEKALEKVITRANDLLSMISSILDTVRLEAGVVEVGSHKFSLVDFLEGLRSSYDVPTNKRFTLTWDYQSDFPMMITDSEKLKRILKSLIDNAIKFTANGSVTISARYVPAAEAVEFKVVDSGIGISKEAMPLIFERFRQLDSSETRVYGGVGLGLYIVKKLTELIGGKIGLESAPGKGSIFTVTIPVAIHQQAGKQEAERILPSA